MAVITLILQPLGYYSDGDWRYSNSQVIVINFIITSHFTPSSSCRFIFTPVNKSPIHMKSRPPSLWLSYRFPTHFSLLPRPLWLINSKNCFPCVNRSYSQWLLACAIAHATVQFLVFITESGRGIRTKYVGQWYENSGPFHNSVICLVNRLVEDTWNS